MAEGANTLRFLLIVLYGFRDPDVSDAAHVASIDAHPEHHRGDDDIEAFLCNGVLGSLSPPRI